ncbi:membrane protein [Brachybacterium phenoliresistens]|uniref:Probable membrane transporter protein n=1 Tax=Brachybacterium phenoliresistens TaxID=396014 RepID=Z9JME6_9MICO|nr:sulfite exporter TauE/SafE family protein [Brachybacterium phenoliresistens]EWS79570.1 membrane protein [Brachybacterium phenoliresistens]
MPELDTVVWIVLGLGALVVGLSKTAVPGAGTIAVALFASVLPAKASTGALLVLLIVGDMMALLAYRRHADWRVIVKMAPAVVLGLVAGWGFLAVASDAWVRRGIGALLLMVIAVTLCRRWRGSFAATRQASSDATSAAGAAQGAGGSATGGSETGGGATGPASAASGQGASAPTPAPGGGGIAAWTYGSLGGFTTMVANAAGPVMSMYFLAAKFPVKAFLGTSAWFFAAVNIAKLPFSIGLGIINPSSLLLDLVLVPLVLVGGLGGRLIAQRISQKTFEWVVVVLTVVGAAYLLV